MILIRLLLNEKSYLGDGEDPLGIGDGYFFHPFKTDIPLMGIALTGMRMNLYWIQMGFVHVHHEVIFCFCLLTLLLYDIDFQWFAAIWAF